MDFWIYHDYHTNLYHGCSHGCIYCDSRSECYQIQNFDQIKPKENCIQTLEKDLYSKRIKGVIGMGSMSDPYNPLEKTLKLTRKALELYDKYGFGTTVITKSDLILRDIDIYKKINKYKSVLINITITTADESLQKIIEPNASTTVDRFIALEKLNEAGIKAGIILDPVLPYINDTIENIDSLVEMAKKYHVHHIFPMYGVTLRDKQRAYYYNKLDQHFPGIKEKYMKTYGNNYLAESPKAKQLHKHLVQKCKEYGILYDIRKINEDFLKGPKQLALELWIH